MTKTKPKPKPKRAVKRITLDMSYANAATLIVKISSRVRFVLVGCGGTGSWVAPSIARLMRVLREGERKVSAVFVDPDLIEAKNIGRQNFCDAELGLSKAVCLATRYNAAWGLDIAAVNGRFEEHMLGENRDVLNIVVGCVDNAAGRQAMHAALKRNSQHNYRNEDVPYIWWLDAGNDESSGQVLLGSTHDHKKLQGTFNSTKACFALPSPALVMPDLLKPKPEESFAEKMSCAELQFFNAQSLIINQRVAAEMAEYLYRLAVHGGLRRFGSYFDQSAGSQRSMYITPESIAGAVNKPLESLGLLEKKPGR